MSDRIVIFAWRDIGHPEHGGAEVYITKVAEHLAKKGSQVVFLTAGYPNAKSYEKRNGVEYIRFGNKFSIYIALPLLFLLKYRKSTDIVIENYNVWPFCVPLLHRNSVTIIHHIQQQEWESEFGKIGKILRTIAWTLLKVLYSGKNIVTVSESSRADILGLGIKPKAIDIIYNGIEDLFFSLVTAEKPKDKINLLCLGRVKKHKRLNLVFDLIARVVAEGEFKNIHVDVVGQGDELENLREQVKNLGIEKYVTFHGYVNSDERMKLVDQSHLHFQLSQKEGWGITVMEAASRGVPTICFNVPGLRDSVKFYTGYVVNDENSLYSTFTGALKDIQAQSENYLNKQKEGRLRALGFRWHYQLDKWDELSREYLQVKPSFVPLKSLLRQSIVQ